MRVVEYEESFGTVNFPEGFEEEIKGLPIEEQAKHFHIVSACRFEDGWREQIQQSGGHALEKDDNVHALIVRDGLIVGVMMSNECGEAVPCLPEQRICTYYASDNNGAGYKDRTDYAWLSCRPLRQVK